MDKPIAYGRTAEIFAWENYSILKRFHTWFPLSVIEYELNIAQFIHASEMKSPAVEGKILSINGRHALVFERVDGESMLVQFSAQP